MVEEEIEEMLQQQVVLLMDSRHGLMMVLHRLLCTVCRGYDLPHVSNDIVYLLTLAPIGVVSPSVSFHKHTRQCDILTSSVGRKSHLISSVNDPRGTVVKTSPSVRSD